MRALSNVIGFDDAPFARSHEGHVPVVGTVYASHRFDGVLIGHVEKDGFDAANRLGQLVTTSKFSDHIQAILLQGVTLAGFNVVDVFLLNEITRRPVIVVSRRQPDFERIRSALLEHVEGGAAKWDVIERLGPMKPAGDVFIQCVSIDYREAVATIRRFAQHGHMPEPLRTAHLIAGAVAEGESRGQP